MQHNERPAENSILFCVNSDFPTFITPKKNEKFASSSQKLFLLSNYSKISLFENIPKNFIISTKNSTCYFNLEMIKEVSPIISEFIRQHPDDNHYNLDINDEERVIKKFEQLFLGEKVTFDEDEIPSSQKITKMLQITNFPNCLKPKSLQISDEFDLNGNKVFQPSLPYKVSIYKEYFANFLNKTEFKTFKIKTKKKEYMCSILGVYLSNVIKQFLLKNSTAQEFDFNFEDEYEEFQLICNFFNSQQVDITNSNMDLLKEIAEDLQINSIIKQIDDYIIHYETISKKIDENQKLIDSIDQLFELLYHIREYSIESVKISIVQSKWSKNEKDVQELAAFILQIVKSNFSLQKEMVELLIELNKEANETNKLNILLPFIIHHVLYHYMPQSISESVYSTTAPYNKKFKYFFTLEPEKIIYDNVEEIIYLGNKCIYSFIRILYKKVIIPKETIMKNLKNYDCNNLYLNAFFLPEIIESNPKNINLMIFKKQKNMDLLKYKLNFSNLIQKYLPDKIDLYEKMIDNIEPDDDLTNSIRNDDVDSMQKIIVMNGIDSIKNAVIPYNIFDGFDENLNLLNYAAYCGSLKCFKYLLLNDGQIDKSTNYFAVVGGNVEIIKIVDQNNSFDLQFQDINSVSSSMSTSEEKLNYNELWFVEEMRISYSEYNYDFINTYEIISKISGIKTCLIYTNPNNLIASIITMHRNDLFDWLFEKLFINKNKLGKELNFLAYISASTGNVHSLIEIFDKGFDMNNNSISKIIDYSAKNGFYKLTQLIYNIIEQKTKGMCSKFTSIVYFGNQSIFKLLIEHYQYNVTFLKQVISYAINFNYNNIVYCFFDITNNDFFYKNDDFIFDSLTISIQTKDGDLFNFLIEKFEKLNPNSFKLNSFIKLLNDACKYSNLFVTKKITDLILNENPKFNFTDAFINAASSGSINICKYFIDKKVIIIYDNLSTSVSQFGAINVELFEMIYNNVSPNNKYKLLKCIDKAIKMKNKKLIEFVLKQNAPIKSALFEAVSTHDVEIVDLILKYNSKPSFVNQKRLYLTAISFETALIYASRNKDLDIVKRLLSVPGINPSIFGQSNLNALTVSINNYDYDIFDAILTFYGDDFCSNTLLFVKTFEKLQEMMYQSDKIVWKMIKRFLEIKSIDPNYFDKYPLLTKACSDNEIEIVEKLLSMENIDVNISDGFNVPLIVAIKNNNSKIAELLIDHPNTDINFRNDKNETPLLYAIKNNLKDIVDLLINDERFDPIENRLSFAFAYSKDDTISQKLYSLEFFDANQPFEIFIENKKLYITEVYKNAKNRKLVEVTPLIHFAQINDIEKLEMIINHPSFDKYKSDINEAILKATITNNVNVFKKLINLIDNDINIVNVYGHNILMFAAIYSSGSIIDEILNNPKFDSIKCQINSAFIESYSSPNQYRKVENDEDDYITKSLEIKISQNILNSELLPEISDVIEIMNKIYNFDKSHDNIINLNEISPYNGNSFLTNIQFDYSEIGDVCKFLLDNGVDPNLLDDNGNNPLMIAINLNSLDFVKSLLNSNKVNLSQEVIKIRSFISDDLTVTEKTKTTYLHLATECKKSEIFTLLLDSNAIDINAVDEHGNTPLMKASVNSKIDIVNLLFTKDNLDYLHCNNEGKDAITIYKEFTDDVLKYVRKSKEIYHNALASLIASSHDPHFTFNIPKDDEYND